MQPRKVKFLFLALAVVSGLLFAGAEARAVTFSYNMQLGDITTSKDVNNVQSATYTYLLSQNPGSSTLSYIDFEIPVEIMIPLGVFAGSTANFSVKYFSSPTATTGVFLGGEVYPDGDYGTKFGVGDLRYRVLKVNIPSPSPSFKIVLTLKEQRFSDGRLFADASQSDWGAVLIKAGNGTNTQTFIIPTPTVVAPPAYPRPVFSTLNVYPNPAVLPACTTVSWTVSNATEVTIDGIDGPVPVSGDYATICLTAADTKWYTITATGSGGSTSETFSVTALDAPPPPLVISMSILPNPVTPPGCATATLQGLAEGTVVEIVPSGSAAISTDPNGNPVATICFDQDTVPGTHTYQLTATEPGGSTSTVSFSVTTNPPPLIETTCKQVRKNMGSRKTCTYICLSTTTDGVQSLESATWFDNPDCLGEGVLLEIYGENSPQKTLVCSPCRYTDDPNDPHPQACTTNESTDAPPFRMFQGNYWHQCEVFRYQRQDQGSIAVLGDDWWGVVNGKTVWIQPKM